MSSTKPSEAKREKDIRFCYEEMTENIALPSMQGLEQNRIDRALDLALSPDPLVKYETNWETCLCPDSGYRGITWICKHRLAYMMRRRDRLWVILWLGDPLYYSKEVD